MYDDNGRADNSSYEKQRSPLVNTDDFTQKLVSRKPQSCIGNFRPKINQPRLPKH